MAPSKKVLATALKEQRKEERAKVGALKSLTIQPNTKIRYLRAVFVWQCWFALAGLAAALTWDQLDHQVSEYLEMLWAEGEPKNLAGDTLSGIQWLLNTKRVLPGSWRLLDVWTRNEMPARAPAMPAELLVALAGYAVLVGAPDVAALSMVGFAGTVLYTHLTLPTICSV